MPPVPAEQISGFSHYGDVRAAAKHIGCSESFLNKARVSGSGPPYYKIGRLVLYSIPEVDSWIAGRRRQSTSETEAA
ncbi:MAG: DNA-binding protein [Caulobacteraceae bacterium]|nr:DNA-binding protein [Caulobacteraceae bacterium]